MTGNMLLFFKGHVHGHCNDVFLLLLFWRAWQVNTVYVLLTTEIYWKKLINYAMIA